MTDISAASLQKFRDQIDLALKPQHLVASGVAIAEAVGPPAVQADFCALWPTAKPILQAVAGIIGFIPAVGTGAAPILNALIAVGDQIFNATCNRPAAAAGGQ